MKLILDVISGKFQGNQIILDSLNSHVVRPMLTETDPIKITLELDSPVTSATILIEDARIKLSPENDDGKRFSAMPSHYAGSNHTALFHNYFGIALLYVETTTNTEGTDSNIELVGEIDILARKLTSDQAQGMVKYILDSGNVDLLRSQGATRRGISSSDDESKPAKKIIEQLEETVKLFENALPKLVRSPLSTLKSNLEIVSVTRDL